MDTTEYRTRLKQAMLSGSSKAHAVDVTGYPADVSEVIAVVCELWYLVPPQTKKGKAYWIQQARELMDACGEFGIDAVRGYRDDFEDDMRKHNGIAQHTVEGPGSLVKMVRALAGTLREGVRAHDRYMRQDERSRRRYSEE